MRKIIDPFTVNLPHLDLHGEISSIGRVLIDSFVNENYKLRNEKIVIIHGKSGGILKKMTADTLRKNNKVKKYYIDGLNDGQTIVELNLD